MKHALLIPLLLLACSPAEMADKAVARVAETVIAPVVDDNLTGAQAQGVTRCIIENASPAELEALARDVGVMAGTATVANVRAIAERPETMACIANAGLPQPRF